jgi:hypothetical protein
VTPLQVAFKAGLLARYPEQDRADVPFPPHTWMVRALLLCSALLSSRLTTCLWRANQSSASRAAWC